MCGLAVFQRFHLDVLYGLSSSLVTADVCLKYYHCGGGVVTMETSTLTLVINIDSFTGEESLIASLTGIKKKK